MANHEKFREVLFQASPCLGLLHFLLLFSYLLAKVADPEQSNSLWLTDWLTGEKGTLHLSFFFLQPLPSSYPSCPAGGMWLWHIAVPLHKCSRTHLYPQFPLPQQASTALSASVNWEDEVFLWPITPFAAVAAAGNGWPCFGSLQTMPWCLGSNHGLSRADTDTPQCGLEQRRAGICLYCCLW